MSYSLYASKPAHWHAHHPRMALNESHYSFIGIPAKDWGAQIHLIEDEDARAKVQRYVDRVVEVFVDGVGLWVLGSQGSGKTSIGALLAKVAFAYHFNATWISISDLREQILHRGVWWGDGETPLALRILETDVLILDGLRSEDAEARVYGRAEISSLIRGRCTAGKATIVTTRLAPKDLDQQFHGLYADTEDRMAQVLVSSRRTNPRRGVGRTFFDGDSVESGA